MTSPLARYAVLKMPLHRYAVLKMPLHRLLGDGETVARIIRTDDGGSTWTMVDQLDDGEVARLIGLLNRDVADTAVAQLQKAIDSQETK